MGGISDLPFTRLASLLSHKSNTLLPWLRSHTDIHWLCSLPPTGTLLARAMNVITYDNSSSFVLCIGPQDTSDSPLPDIVVSMLISRPYLEVGSGNSNIWHQYIATVWYSSANGSPPGFSVRDDLESSSFPAH